MPLMAHSADLLSSVRMEYDRNVDFRTRVAEAVERLRARGVETGPDREALSLLLEDGRLLGKVLLDSYLARADEPQWQMAKRMT